jgi:transcriptional regulator with XRE-family HTH domain
MDEEDVPESGDGLFGYNMRKLRERAGLSQAALAIAMQERSWPWHQSTIYRIESGRQTVSFWESRDLAAILGVSPERFAWKPADANAADALYMSASRVRGCAEEVVGTVTALLSARTLAQRAIEDTAQYDSPRVRDAREVLDDTLGACDLEAAIAEGVRQYEEMTRDDGEDDEGDGDAPAAESPDTAQRSA